MGQALAKKLYYSKEEYLEIEAASGYKSEYYQGEIFAMAGGTRKHSIICLNLNWAIREATSNTNCTGFESNVKLEIAEANAYVYPDLAVVCGDVEAPENTSDIITNPVLIIEVLSPSTELFDRNKKFEYYQMLTSLKEYVLVSQDKPMIEVYYKHDAVNWLYSVVRGLDKNITLKSLNYDVALKDVYYKTGI